MARITRRALVLSVLGLSAAAALATALSGRLALALVNAITNRRGYALRADLAYGANLRHRLDLYLPEGMTEATPLVVFFYGGAWQSGDKESYRFVAHAFVRSGYAVAIPNYRVYPEAIFPAFVDDAAASIAWLAAVPELAARPLVLVGHSAGAHIALLATLDERFLAKAGSSARITAAVGLSGPYDFLPLREAVYKAIFPEAVRDDSQPIRFVDGREPPVLLLTGDADETVDPGNSTRLARRIERRGGKAEVKVYEGVGHVDTLTALAQVLPFRNKAILDDILAFLGRLVAEG